MRERPILYSTLMVQAILEGRKTMTRRLLSNRLIINSRPDRYKSYGIDDNGSALFEDLRPEITPWITPIKCPYGKPGDLLWVRETHYRYGQWVKNGATKSGRQKWMFKPDQHFNEVRFYDNPPAKIEKNSSHVRGWYKRPSLFLPLKYARIWLEITNISVERIQDISKEDAKAEGISSIAHGYKNYLSKQELRSLVQILFWPTAYHSFQSLWESINGSESWNLNPFVWVVSFNVLSSNRKHVGRKEYAHA